MELTTNSRRAMTLQNGLLVALEDGSYWGPVEGNAMALLRPAPEIRGVALDWEAREAIKARYWALLQRRAELERQRESLATPAEWNGLTFENKAAYLAALNPLGIALLAQRIGLAGKTSMNDVLRAWVAIGVLSLERAAAARAER